jgi:Neuraminidase (sialidase)
MKRVYIILAVLAVFAATAYAGWSGATADRYISYYSGDSKRGWISRITKGPEGNLYAIWLQDISTSAREIAFGMSTDNGVTWSSETMDVIIAAQDTQNPPYNSLEKYYGIATDSFGNIYVVWAEDLVTTHEIMLLKSTDLGSTWIHSDTDFNISYDGAPYQNAADPDIAIDGNDNIYVVWHQRTDIEIIEIHISISTDLGVTWSGRSADRQISFSSGHNASLPDIAVAPNNDIYVVWGERDGSLANTARIQYGKSTDGGATFNSETADLPITTQVYDAEGPYIVTDSSGDIHVAFRGSRATSSPYITEILYTGSTDAGATWSGNTAPILIDPGKDDGRSAQRHALAVTSEDNLVAVWNETPDTMTHSEIWASYSTDGGATWTGTTSADLISYPDSFSAFGPDVVAGAGDTLHVIWHEPFSGGTTYHDIHYSKGDTLVSGGGGPGGCDYIVGDVNGSDSYNGLDITYGVNFFKGGSLPLCPECAPCSGFHYCGDVNGSCSYNGLDITYGVNYFKGGNSPVHCGDCPPNP